MSKKAKRNPDDTTSLLRQLLKDLIELGNLRREEVRYPLRGGLLLKYRPPDVTNVNCRLLAYRMDAAPSLAERRIVRSALEVVLMTTLAKGAVINEPGDVFWHNGFGCYLYTWSPDTAKQQLELFATAGAA